VPRKSTSFIVFKSQKCRTCYAGRGRRSGTGSGGGKKNYIDILNFFDNRSTNASAESFNAKIKNFRAQLRGISDIKYFLFRLQKIYA
jgi:hypothetical protein